jgi:hypothetical protein
MLSAPRRGVAVPNPAGDLALFTTTQYSFGKQSTSAKIESIDLKTGAIADSGLNADEINEWVWLPGTETGIIYINGTNEEVPGGVTIWIGDAKQPSKKLVLIAKSPQTIVAWMR